MTQFTVRLLQQQDLPEALSLVWQVFQQFEAPDYSPEGVAEFRAYIAPESILPMQRSGAMTLWGSFAGDTLAGVSAVRPAGHVSLLFVGEAYHRQGTARGLVEAMAAHAAAHGCARMTVNASPYAHAAYRRMGFADTGAEQTVNGLRFIPMQRALTPVSPP